MALTELHVRGYRSLRSLRLPLRQLNVITGPNGSGKSNLYRALWLIARICEGDFARSLCKEGGFLSALWAGPRENNDAIRMSLGFRTDAYAYELNCGFPAPGSTFWFDPEIKDEAVWFGTSRKPSTTMMERKAGITRIRDGEGNRVEFPLILSENESLLAQLREPQRFPELFNLREEVRHWRFYHQFRTDENAPLRCMQISTATPVLSHDGSDLAAALLSIEESSNGALLHEAIELALPGRKLEIMTNEKPKLKKLPSTAEMCVALETDGCERPFLARELSDGTLKFLCLAAALLSPRPPNLMAFNEPEASLHPDVLPVLAKLIVETSRYSQIWVTTHSQILVDAIQELSHVEPVELEMVDGETLITNARRLG